MENTDKSALERTYEANLPAFESISTLPEHGAECARCAAWLAARLRAIGMEAELLETKTKPVVYGCRKGDAGRPTVLFYGHYDVQPVDPLSFWQSHPFKAEQREGRIYARGAQDNKGQIVFFLSALQALIDQGALRCTVKVLIEGEEEAGSAGLRGALPGWNDKIKADVLMVCDSDCAAPGVPAIAMGLRGVIGLTVRLGGLKKDLHSGQHGGVVQNPALEMARLLATLHRPDGAVAVTGFYDGIAPVSDEERRLVACIPFDVEAYRAAVGVAPIGGEKGYLPRERSGFRPTIEVNGVHSGYGGPGTKTIIPAHAVAKLTARLVAGQEPQRCLDLMIEHLRSHAPAGLELEISEAEVAGPAMRCDPKSALVQRAAGVLKLIFEREPVFVWEGGSVPIVADLARIVKGNTLLVGFGLEADNVHAPNESFSLEQLKWGFLYAAMMLQELGRPCAA
jgi:acetylornithine deacetylase/succinyl-diaminopimelate desuccinylase-like protein